MGRGAPRTPPATKADTTTATTTDTTKVDEAQVEVESDNKGGTVRKKRGGGKRTSSATLAQAVDTLFLMRGATDDLARLRKSYAETIKTFPVEEVNAALTAKGLDLADFQPPAVEGAATPSNMVTENTVTTGSVVPVTSSDGSLPPVPANGATQPSPASPTPEQAAALQALGLKGGNPPQQTAAPQATVAAPKQPSIKEMIGMLMGQNSYAPPPEPGPPVLSQVRNVNPADIAGQPTVLTTTGDYKPTARTQPFAFPPGFVPPANDGRVQLTDVDYQRAALPFDPAEQVQYTVGSNSAAQPTAQQLSGKKEPDNPDPFADIPLDPNIGWEKMKRNRANMENRAKGYAAAGGLGLAGLTGLGLLGYGGVRGLMALSSALGGGSQPKPQPQGEDPDEAILMNTNTVGGFR
jgi:hypothetical protein